MHIFSCGIKRIFRQGIGRRIVERIFCNLKGRYYTWLYASGKGRIRFRSFRTKLYISLGSGAKLELIGDLIILPHVDDHGRVSIKVSDRGTVRILNEFVVGEGVSFLVMADAELEFGGKKYESASGITCNTLVMCYHKIKVGYDMICSWNVYLTDSDWHGMKKEGEIISHNGDVLIGNHCWIGSNVIIGKNTTIGDDCIIPAFSKISNKILSNGVTFGGLPSKMLSSSLEWRREIF